MIQINGKQQQALSASGSSGWYLAWRRLTSAVPVSTLLQTSPTCSDELFTDARVVVEGILWHVHRAMLAAAGPILKHASYVGAHAPKSNPHACGCIVQYLCVPLRICSQTFRLTIQKARENRRCHAPRIARSVYVSSA